MESGNHGSKPHNGLPEPTGEDELEFWKQYLIEHPDNKMAWYLLGKAYDRQHKPGKANYCYMQAGDVYRAYEKKAIAVEAMPEPLQKLELAQPDESPRQSDKRKRRRLGALLLIVLLTFFASSSAEEEHSEVAGNSLPELAADNAPHAEEELAPAQDMEEGAEHEQYLQPVGDSKWGIHLLASDGTALEDDRVSAAAAIGRVLVDASNSAEHTLVVQANAAAGGNRQWIQWINGMNVLVAIDRPDRAGASRVHRYDAHLCECVPAPLPNAHAAALQTWQRAQEELLVAMSAAERHGQASELGLQHGQQLTEDYPNNALPGLTALMMEQLEWITLGEDVFPSEPTGRDVPSSYFPFHTKLQLVDTGSGAAAAAIQTASFGSSGEQHQANPAFEWKAPLEIIVDTSVHKLAVVSGSVILRNYTVGLGGELTPLGEFEITEKVRNPNGRDDGDFGSRGMTLSDTLYAIHGTNEPESIGKDESLGCVRMGKEDVEELFDMVPLGTKVTITRGVLPDQEMVPEERFRLPSEAQETNDAKVYRWL
ncbi:L,D-transpeptidase [Xylanibacillus composti]|uniref:L,D-TPase catalytic domain-containing protein n=1 Tax=Xylanibacillus composti TaxID=1572762 RepID=A0A8J4M0R0_9BACL|nr:L,D-transpeptidase [Xylanibacillus composti]MDT9725650.1 L,D-transpeptidase [Xylanibacillus composti]GIQ67744.1 hypothetical protein XYCOK13_05680 [Xylanibacillus composti]